MSNELKHYGVKGMKWGKQKFKKNDNSAAAAFDYAYRNHFDPFAYKGYGQLGKVVNTSLVGLKGNRNDLNALRRFDASTKSIVGPNGVASKASVNNLPKNILEFTKKRYNESSESSGTSKSKTKAPSSSPLDEAESKSKDSKSKKSKSSGSSGSSRRKSSRRSGGGSSSRKNPKSKKNKGDKMHVDNVDSTLLDNSQNKGKTGKTGKKASQKKTSDTVRSNANTSVNSSEAMALIRQYKTFVDQLLRAFSTMGYSRSQAEEKAKQTVENVYTPGVADPKVKVKKRG